MSQSILRTDGMIEHHQTSRCFGWVQAWWNLRLAGPGARSLTEAELSSLRVERTELVDQIVSVLWDAADHYDAAQRIVVLMRARGMIA